MTIALSARPPKGKAMDRKVLGLRLRELREAAGISQKALADLVGEEQSSVSRWEQGKMEIPGAHIPDICALLGCTLEELFRPPTKALPKRGRGRPKKLGGDDTP